MFRVWLRNVEWNTGPIHVELNCFITRNFTHNTYMNHHTLFCCCMYWFFTQLLPYYYTLTLTSHCNPQTNQTLLGRCISPLSPNATPPNFKKHTNISLLAVACFVKQVILALAADSFLQVLNYIKDMYYFLNTIIQFSSMCY